MLRRVVRKVRSSLGYFAGLVIAVIVGGATTALVMAAIPDSSGVIHGCRSNVNGGLRVIDSASQQCLAAETAINWNQTGPQGPAGATSNIAYAHVNYDSNTHVSSLDGNRSKNIINFVDTPGEYICMQANFAPKNIITSMDFGPEVAIKDENGWSNSEGEAYCGNTENANVFMFVPNRDFFCFYTIARCSNSSNQGYRKFASASKATIRKTAALL